MAGFSFGKYRGKAGKELKQRFSESGETFDVIGMEEDLSADGHPIWRMHIIYGDGEKGMLFWGMDPEDDRSKALADLAAGFQEGEIAAQPAVIRVVRTRAGRDYYWLDDPS